MHPTPIRSWACAWCAGRSSHNEHYDAVHGVATGDSPRLILRTASARYQAVDRANVPVAEAAAADDAAAPERDQQRERQRAAMGHERQHRIPSRQT